MIRGPSIHPIVMLLMMRWPTGVIPRSWGHGRVLGELQVVVEQELRADFLRRFGGLSPCAKRGVAPRSDRLEDHLPLRDLVGEVWVAQPDAGRRAGHRDRHGFRYRVAALV